MPRTSYRYSLRIEMSEDTAEDLRGLSASTGFKVDTPGGNFGKASPSAFLASLAAAYRRDPALVARTLAALGVRPEKKPVPPTAADASPSP